MPESNNYQFSFVQTQLVLLHREDLDFPVLVLEASYRVTTLMTSLISLYTNLDILISQELEQHFRVGRGNQRLGI